MANSDSIIREAMRATEREVFGEAFGNDEPVLDETGDRSLEEMGTGLEGQHEPDEDDEPETEETGDETETPEPKTGETEGKDKPTEATPKPEVEPEPKGRVPAGRLREETKRAQAAEAALAEAKAKIAEAEVRTQERHRRADCAVRWRSGRSQQTAATRPAESGSGQARWSSRPL